MNQGIHLLDLLVWMMGPVESVQAQARTSVHDIEVEDTLVATLTFTSGALGSLLATTAAYPQLPARLQVHGALGSAVIEDFELGYLHYSDTDKSGSRHDSQAGDDLAPQELAAWGGELDVTMGASHARQYADFASAIRTDSRMRVTIADAVRSLEVISGIYRSAAEAGAVVRLG
jgi:predicted dehydrogenase